MERHLGQIRVCRRRGAEEYVLDDRVLVYGVIDRLAQILVIEWLAGDVDRDLVDPGDGVLDVGVVGSLLSASIWL